MTFHAKRSRERSALCYGCHEEPRINGQSYGRECRNKYERERKRRVTLTKSVERAIRERCDRLRETAQQLKKGEINAHHAANRIAKIANEIAGARA